MAMETKWERVSLTAGDKGGGTWGGGWSAAAVEAAVSGEQWPAWHGGWRARAGPVTTWARSKARGLTDRWARLPLNFFIEFLNPSNFEIQNTGLPIIKKLSNFARRQFEAWGNNFHFWPNFKILLDVEL
jgi:hypothetical protein